MGWFESGFFGGLLRLFLSLHFGGSETTGSTVPIGGSTVPIGGSTVPIGGSTVPIG